MPIRVLLVDDVVEVRAQVREALDRQGGFEVIGEAGGGADAVRLAAQLRPDVVVLDLGLPDIAGREVLSRIRSDAPETRVVVFSGLDSGDRSWLDTDEKCVVADADLDYLATLIEAQIEEPDRSAGEEAVLDLPHDLGSVATARRFVGRTIAAWELDAPVDDALLVVSELAANALMHAESSYRVRVATAGPALRIEVEDDGTGTPEPRPLTLTAERGRGLHLVDALAASWGMEVAEHGGKRVWAELPVGSVGAE